MAGPLGGDNDEPIASINMTPFVDIVLVVLIIFMVTTPIIMKPTIKVNLPRAASGEESPPTELNISITADGGLILNGQTVSNEDLSRLSREKFDKNPEVQAVISADKDVPHGKVVGAIDVIKSVGIHRFAISIEKQTATP